MGFLNRLHMRSRGRKEFLTAKKYPEALGPLDIVKTLVCYRTEVRKQGGDRKHQG
jgi:hypothetical protein